MSDMKKWEERLSPAVCSIAPSGIRKFFDIAATMDDVIAFVEALREEFNRCDFYCSFEMDEDGVLTKLSYYYIP